MAIAHRDAAYCNGDAGPAIRESAVRRGDQASLSKLAGPGSWIDDGLRSLRELADRDAPGARRPDAA